MSDIEFINIYSRRNHICNFPKQTLQHPLAICRALLFISQQLRHFSQTKHWSPHTFGHIVHKRYCISFILFPLSVWSGWVCLVAVALPWWPYWPSPSSAPLGWTLTDCALIFPQGRGRRERTTAHTDTHHQVIWEKRSMPGRGGGRIGVSTSTPSASPDVSGCTAQWQRQRDNMNDHMVSVIPQLNRDMKLKLELNQQQIQADIHRWMKTFNFLLTALI